LIEETTIEETDEVEVDHTEEEIVEIITIVKENIGIEILEKNVK
jgi:hypothetical protein